jgi:hypothetical protein
MVAMKMGRWLRCSLVTSRNHFDTGGKEPDLQERKMVRDAPSTASPARTALPAAHFDRNEWHAISATEH